MDPDLARLTGAGAEGLLATLLATGDEELASWRVRSVDHRPGRSTTVAYDARVRGAAGERAQVLGASSGLATTAAPGVHVLDEAGRPVAVWRFPHDPGLPGLPVAADERAVAALLRTYGLGACPVELRVRSYRPRRRAVVEVGAGDLRVFLKVLRPSAAQALHDRHVLLRGAGLPVPRSLGRTDEGVLVLEGLSGRTLRERLREGGGPAPDGPALVALLDRLPDEVCALPARRSWSDEVAHYAAVTASALPSEADRCRQLADRVLAGTADLPAEEPVHGDFYETQVLLEGARISGLLDVDTAGPGRRADDLACLLAHAHVLAAGEPAHRTSTAALGARWLTAFDRRVDPVELRTRVAGVVVSLATGPHRVQQAGWQDVTRARLDLAEAWLDSADRARGAQGRR